MFRKIQGEGTAWCAPPVVKVSKNINSSKDYIAKEKDYYEI